MNSAAAIPDAKELTNALLMHVKCQAHSLPNETVANIENLLAEITATLREGLNSRVPLFLLPVEVLQRILEQVPSPLSHNHDFFRPFWDTRAVDTSMLLPLLHTCRHLRKIAISHTTLWRTVSPATRYRLPIIPLNGCGLDIPLITIIDGDEGAGVLGNFNGLDTSRIQELHLLNLRSFRTRDDVAELRRHFKDHELPLLETLSICGVITIDGKGCLSLKETPRLRHMMLQSVTFVPQNTFPHLTHLALADVYMHDCHQETANLLSRCPNLESLAINYPSSDMIVPQRPQRPLALNRLRRVFFRMPQFHLEFYLSVLPIRTRPQDEPIAIQIQDHQVDDHTLHLGTLLLQATKGEASHLSLSLTPAPDNLMFIVISVTGPQGAFHVTSSAFNDWHRPGDWDILHGLFVKSVLDMASTHLTAVREVWIGGQNPETMFEDHIAAAFRSAVASLPALETIVFVVQTTPGCPPTGPNLWLCPSALDGCVSSPELKTLRVVYGNDVRHKGHPIVEQLNLTRLLAQVETGAYRYFDALLLHMKPTLVVSRVDLQRLKVHFATVKYRHVERMPTMPVPDYCIEPHGGPGGSGTWLGSLW